MTTTQTPRVAIGTQQMSFTMQPCGRNGHPINGGNHYANAHTIEDARAYAQRVLAAGEVMGYVVRSVSIDGSLFEFKGHAWVSLHRECHSEVIRSELPYPYTKADLAKQCYDTTVMDYFETVHERRSDGTCKCGNPTRNARI